MFVLMVAGGPPVTNVSGGLSGSGRLMVNVRDAGMVSTFPAWSRARTKNVYVPSERFEYVLVTVLLNGEKLDSIGARRNEYTRLCVGVTSSEPVHSKVTSRVATESEGPPVMLVSGATMS